MMRRMRRSRAYKWEEMTRRSAGIGAVAAAGGVAPDVAVVA
jgi:hypothetical protein